MLSARLARTAATAAASSLPYRGKLSSGSICLARTSLLAPSRRASGVPSFPAREPREPGYGVLVAFLLAAVPTFALSSLSRFLPALVTREEVIASLPDRHKPAPGMPASAEQVNAYIIRHRPDLVKLARISRVARTHTSLVPAKFLPQYRDTGGGPPAPWHTLVTHAFNHGSIVHFFCCYMGLKAFVPPLAEAYGSGRTAALFLIGAAAAGGGVVAYERMLPKPDQNAYVANVGSSGAILAMGTIAAIVRPSMRLGIMFIPYDFSIRRLLCSLAAFDVVGAFVVDYGLGISHLGHLGSFFSLLALLLYHLPLA